MSATVARPSGQTCIFGDDNPGFRENFDESPFAFSHSFTADHPSFQLSRIRKLIGNPGVRGVTYYDAGEVAIGQRFEDLPERKLTLEEAFDRVGNNGAWMMIRKVHQDPEYNELLEQSLANVKALSGRNIDEDKKSQEAIIFLTSPKRITTYHIDRECNFLMQVSGAKDISIFERSDRVVTPEEELESFWSKDHNAGVYKPQFQDRAHVYKMTPGTGVHIPVNSPHWVQNGDNISITFSISYQYKDTKRKYVYQANYYLRKLGLKPTPPGQSAMLDNTKKIVMGVGLRGKKLLRPRKG